MNILKDKRILPGDLIVIILLVVLSVLSALFFIRGGQGRTAVITENGKVLARLDITEEQMREYTIGEDISIAYGKGCIYFQDSDCPDKDCIKTGQISKSGETAICLPNRVQITIEGEGEIDAVSG